MLMAFDAAKKAISADVTFPEAYALLGHVYLVRGDTKKAIEMCEKAVEIAPSDAYGLALLANVLIDSGQIIEGIQTMKRAMRLCPFPPAWYFSLMGTGFHLNGDNEAAIFALEQAVEREPNSHLSRLWLASALVESGKLDEARAVSKEVLNIEPNFLATNWAETFKSKTHAQLKDNMLAAGFPE